MSLMDSAFYSDNPPDKVYFQIAIEYNPNHDANKNIPEESRSLISDPLKTYPMACEEAQAVIQKMCDQYPGSTIVELDPEDQLNEGSMDEFFLFLIDEEENEIAKMGVFGWDYRRATIH